MTTSKPDQPKLTNEETIQLIYNLIEVEPNEDVKHQLRNTLQKLELKKAIREKDCQPQVQPHKFKM